MSNLKTINIKSSLPETIEFTDNIPVMDFELKGDSIRRYLTSIDLANNVSVGIHDLITPEVTKVFTSPRGNINQTVNDTIQGGGLSLPVINKMITTPISKVNDIQDNLYFEKRGVQQYIYREYNTGLVLFDNVDDMFVNTFPYAHDYNSDSYLVQRFTISVYTIWNKYDNFGKIAATEPRNIVSNLFDTNPYILNNNVAGIALKDPQIENYGAQIIVGIYKKDLEPFGYTNNATTALNSFKEYMRAIFNAGYKFKAFVPRLTPQTSYYILSGDNMLYYKFYYPDTVISFGGVDYNPNVVANYDITLTYTSVNVDDEIFNISFYCNNAENNRVDKSEYLKSMVSIRGTFRDSCSVINPTIRITLPYTPNFNYCYIPFFKRYYYITNVVSFRTNVWDLELSCDVLMSFKKDIYLQKGIVARNEFEYNLRINDNLIRNEYVVTQVYEQIETRGFKNFYGNDPNFGNYVLNAIVGNGLVDDYQDDKSFPSETNTVKQPNSNNSLLTNYNAKYFLNDSQLEYILKATLVNEFIANTVISLRAYPLNLPLIPDTDINQPETVLSPIYLLEDIDKEFSPVVNSGGTELLLNRITPYYNNVIDVAQFTLTTRLDQISYLDYEPYRKIYVYLPFYGYIKLDNARIIFGVPIKVQLIVDFDSGNGTYVISNSSTILDRITFKISVDIGISSSNVQSNNIKEFINEQRTAQAVANSIAQMAIGAGSAIAGSMVNPTQASFARGDIGAVGSIAGGIVNIGNSAIDYMLTDKAIVDTVTLKTATGDGSLFYIRKDVEVFEERLNVVLGMPHTEYGHFKGFPLMEIRELTQVRGFTVVSSIHLEGFDYATTDELTAIESALMTGVIL